MKKILASFLLFTLSAAVYCQNTNSPYSILGIGDLETNYYNRTAGMANTGIAYRSDRYLLNNNPASYSALQQQFFAFELSARGQFVSYAGQPINGFSNTSKDFAIKHFAVGTKINKFWGSSFGLMPFSSASYAFTSVKNIQGTNTSVPAQYEGTGGVNQIYWGNAFQLFKHFSVGVNASYLFGSLTQTETLLTSDLQTSLVTTNQIFLKNFYFTYGAQYYFQLNKHWDVSLGGTYSTKQQLAAEYNVQVTDNSSDILKNTITRNDVFRIPTASAAGISITKDKKYTVTADYKYQSWTNSNASGVNYSLENSSRGSVGFEISNKKQYINQAYERSHLQAGLYYGNSYLNVHGQQLKDVGLTVGYGVNSIRSPLGFNVAMEIGQRGTTKNDLIKETYVNFTFTVSYRDFWLTKGRKYE